MGSVYAQPSVKIQQSYQSFFHSTHDLIENVAEIISRLQDIFVPTQIFSYFISRTQIFFLEQSQVGPRLDQNIYVTIGHCNPSDAETFMLTQHKSLEGYIRTNIYRNQVWRATHFIVLTQAPGGSLLLTTNQWLIFSTTISNPYHNCSLTLGLL